jgi:Flp pilus assembly protein TadG
MWRFKLKDQRGQALVEMALVMPILLMMLFGIVEFGRIYNYQLTLSNAVREGARFAAVGPFTDTTPNVETGSTTPVKTEIETKVKDYAAVSLVRANVTVTTNFQGNGTAARLPSGSAQVTATYSVTENIPFIPRNTFNIHSTAIMRVE